MSEDDQQKRVDPLGRPISRGTVWWLRADPWPMLVLALALMCGYFWVYRSPTVAMVSLRYYFDFCIGSFLFSLLAAGRGFQLILRSSYVTRLRLRSGEYQSRRWFWRWFLGIAAGTFLMLWTQLPMYVSFLLSRPALDRLANEALADPGKAHPLAGRWSGLYEISGVEVIGNTVVLYIGRDKGTFGFARVPGAPCDAVSNLPGNEDNDSYYRDFPMREGAKDPEGKRIMGDWFVVYSWYWMVKVGWS